jgi:ElaB/YqjD/DUF883 family membrane-anchored ribosome-binding protein
MNDKEVIRETEVVRRPDGTRTTETVRSDSVRVDGVRADTVRTADHVRTTGDGRDDVVVRRHYEDHRSPDEIERDIASTRAEVSSTIDAIQAKLTPGQLMDQAYVYMKTSLPADFGVNLGNAVRDNPLPVALIGVGIAWLAMTGSKADGQARLRREAALYDRDLYVRDGLTDYDGAYAVDYYDTDGGPREGAMRRAATRAGATSHQLADRASETGQHLKDRASETGHHLAERASQTSQHLKDRAGELGHRMSERGSELAGRAGELAHDARDRMYDTAASARARAGELGHRSQEQLHRAKDRMTHMLEDQPLVLGAIGVAIGAALGAALPRTQRENELMGPTRDELLEGARETVREQVDTMRESAQRVAQVAEKEVARVAGEVSQAAGEVTHAARTQGNGHATRPSASGGPTDTPKPGNPNPR